MIPKSQAQTFIVSNLLTAAEAAAAGVTIQGGESIDFESWRATSFTTDSQQYTLDSVTIANNFFSYIEPAFISIYSDSAGMPGSSLGEFDDDLSSRTSDTSVDPNRHTFSGNFSLEPDTPYWLVFGATGNGIFTYSTTDSADQTGTGSWEIGNSLYAGGGGGFAEDQLTPIMFGMSARVVPEPSTYAIVGGICLIAFAMFRRRQTSNMRKGKCLCSHSSNG